MPTHIRCKGNIGRDLQTVQVDVVIVKKLDPPVLLRLTSSDHPFGIFKLFSCSLFFNDILYQVVSNNN
jgi:hypothetical protein